MNNTRDTGIYFHWPFCLAKCPYCDFNVHVHDTIDQKSWKESYIRSLKHYAEVLPDRKIVSVFFGGGTPSLMPADTVQEILETINDLWAIDDKIEVTLEANPTSIEAQKFKGFRAAGINRVSVGIQSLKDEDLKFLGRKHNVREALQAIEIARENFERFSFDLIYARPGQSLQDWEAELRQAAALAGGHLSLYQLTIERSTPFYMDHAKGRFKMPDEELAVDFYNLTQDILEAEGLPAYEVSNHAATGQESRHNLIYWHYGEYIGIGPGAHGRLTIDGRKVATRDHSAPDIWLQRVAANGCGAHAHEVIPVEEQFTEALMMGLRLRNGVSFAHLRAVTGCDPFEKIDQKRLEQMKKLGWFDDEPEMLRLTREGWLRLNAIVPDLLK